MKSVFVRLGPQIVGVLFALIDQRQWASEGFQREFGRRGRFVRNWRGGWNIYKVSNKMVDFAWFCQYNMSLALFLEGCVFLDITHTHTPCKLHWRWIDPWWFLGESGGFPFGDTLVHFNHMVISGQIIATLTTNHEIEAMVIIRCYSRPNDVLISLPSWSRNLIMAIFSEIHTVSWATTVHVVMSFYKLGICMINLAIWW